MILLGCMVAFGAAIAPRVILVLAWIFSERWAVVWGEQILAPLLGIILLPYTTIMYLLAVTITPTGVALEGFAWVWIALGLGLDAWKWVGIFVNREVGLEKGRSIYKSQN